MTTAAILLAAGKSTRFGREKQYMCIDGVPVWRIVCEAFKGVDIIILITSRPIEGVPPYVHNIVRVTESRYDTINCGLEYIRGTIVTKVIIHDVARYKVQPCHISAILQRDCNATYYMPMREGLVHRETGTPLDKDEYILICTPSMLVDQESQWSNISEEPRYGDYIRGDMHLFKLTYPEDAHKILLHPQDS